MSRERPDQRLHKGRIRDANGRKVTQLDPVALHLLRRHDLIDYEVLTNIVEEKGVGLSRFEKGALIFTLVLIVALIGVFVGKQLSGVPWWPLKRSFIPVVMYIFLYPFIVWRNVKRKRLNNIASAMLKHNCCPHCGYNLTGLSVVEAIGTSIFPECGCVWILNNDAASRITEHA